MNRMTTQIETIVNAYKTLAKIPSIVNGKLMKNGRKITSKWTVRNLDKGKNTKYLYNYVLNDDLNVVAESEFGIDVSNELLCAISPRETFKAVIREEREGKEGKKQYLEVWRKNQLEHSIDLTALDIHGDVYADSEFGSLDWSQDEKSLVYVAEKKLPKSEPYIKRKSEDKPKTNGSGETAPKKGEEFLYRQDWGEQLVGKYLSVVVVCRLETETCSVVEGLPESWCPGQVRISPDGNSVSGVAWETEPRRLGLIFCTNRPSYIFNLTFDGNMKRLSKEGMSVRSPRFTPRGDLVWLQRAAEGPHHACHALVMLPRGQTEVRTIVDIVQTKADITNETFYGLYCQSLPGKCFSADGRRILLSTPQELETRAYVADLEGGRIVDISNRSAPGSTSILDVSSDVILAACSNMTTPGQLYVARLPAAGSEASIKWVRVSEPSEVPPALATATVNYMRLTHEDSQDSVKSFTSLCLLPRSEGKSPLVVWPHGGPHSNFVNAFSMEAALFAMLGFAVLQINYRGSTGCGRDHDSFILSRIGHTDVKDCKLAADEAMTLHPVDCDRVCLYGGSHGGFIVTHLSGQYPHICRAVVTRNPVVDVATILSYTDLPDASSIASGELPRLHRRRRRRRSLPPQESLASVRVNYRGSSGHGDANTRCLVGRSGRYEVADCLLALNTLLERDRRFDDKAVLLNGGSYGGFITAHLAGQYPDKFVAMVMRNPLVDLAVKGHYADNRDGCAVEAGYPFTEEGPVSEEQLLAMRRCSPMAHVHKVKAPTAMLLGSGDKRVPHYQGLEYARRLRANGVHTRIYMYDDNHSLSSPAAEMDNLINSANWFLDHLRP